VQEGQLLQTSEQAGERTKRLTTVSWENLDFKFSTSQGTGQPALYQNQIFTVRIFFVEIAIHHLLTFFCAACRTSTLGSELVCPMSHTCPLYPI
jgi:hypothetical protein